MGNVPSTNQELFTFYDIFNHIPQEFLSGSYGKNFYISKTISGTGVLTLTITPKSASATNQNIDAAYTELLTGELRAHRYRIVRLYEERKKKDD